MSFWIETWRASARFPTSSFHIVTVTSKVPEGGCSAVLGLRENQDKSENPIHPPAAKQPEHNALYFQALTAGGCLLLQHDLAHPM